VAGTHHLFNRGRNATHCSSSLTAVVCVCVCVLVWVFVHTEKKQGTQQLCRE
jgi:hypothetical protein